MLISFLIQKMSKRVSNIDGIDIDVLDDFINSKNISIRNEHRHFFIKYGNNVKLLNNGFSNFTFDKFREYYLDTDLFYTDIVPVNTVFVGIDFDDELLCIDNNTGIIYLYCDQKIDLIYYDSLESLLFFCFLKSEYLDILFEKVNYNIEINKIDFFIKDNEINYIKNIRENSYYLIANKLYEVDLINAVANTYEGGIL